MSDPDWSEHVIARAIALQTLSRKCVVLIDNCRWTGHECDVLAVTTDLRIIDVEVKISRSDLKADAKKDKWWKPLTYAEAHERGVDMWKHKQRILHPRRVWKHYYAMPKEIWKPELLDCLPSPASGVLLLDQDGYPRPPDQAMRVECVRRARPDKDAYRLKPAEVMDIARLANLRMWEAYRQQEQARAESSRWLQQVRAITGGLAA
jgi:hypothetical protein